MVDVRIEPFEKAGRTYWRVRLGQRGLTFQEELAARAFAAQLHLRMGWLKARSTEPDES
ncbi:hypothetical protein [Metapseudomonas resinovorans]|uniref:Uncharacterized protein n=1 Tax=Metapseudomonas resinovorans NBRC 106553 TaxID=1245471 RepID=S6BIG2_METRE|nr:hypothetical protein [Pseudomonas resinovorans]BAN48969.1 hypothetical protein PCA10_32370 [Pseudomonas resinovorans NBRC 106553]